MNTPTYMRTRCVVVALVLLGSGCPLFYDLDGVTPKAPDAAGHSDMPGPIEDLGGDVAPSSDLAGQDMVIPPVDMPSASDLGRGMACPGAAPLDGSCNLVAQDCAPTQVCEVGLLMPGVETGCRDRGGATFALGLGAACDPAGDQRCEPGLFCRGATCERYCYTEGAVGCPADQFCAPLDATNLPGVGWCTDACS